MIVGLGVDLCDVERMRRALEGPAGTRFRARVFTPAEQEYCEARRRGRFASYAARFAAKEAAMKALGTGWGRGVAWRDFEVLPAADGPPGLAVRGEAARVAARRGVTRWLVALSHTDTGAVASVIAEGARLRGVRAGGAAARPRVGGGGSRPRPPRARR